MNHPVGRQQLAKRVSKLAREDGISVKRVRLWIAVQALLATLERARDRGVLARFVVKGGFAIELRFGQRARASRDLDLAVQSGASVTLAAFDEGIRLGWSDFSFVRKTEPKELEHVLRFDVQADYLGGAWATIRVDLGEEDIDDIERLPPIALGRFGLQEAPLVPALSHLEQIAQKIHAATTPPPERNDRARDIIDILLLDRNLQRDDVALLDRCVRIFELRRTHEWPPFFELLPQWEQSLREYIDELAIHSTPEQLVAACNMLILRLQGIIPMQNHEYRFIVLSAQNEIPNVLQNAIRMDAGTGYEAFKRMTETEGFRLAHLLQYPGLGTSRAMLAVLERPKPDA